MRNVDGGHGRAIPWTTGLAWYWVPVLSYAALIVYLSSLAYPDRLAPTLFELLGDKTLHFLEFGLLGILCYRALRQAAGSWGARHALSVAIVAAAVFGLTDEIHQAFVPGREADVWDFVADAVGSCVMTFGWYRFGRGRRREG